ncbi:MAG TPA: hypothetical protein VGO60_02340, partial [Iamia sp.]|nr:hypothetical protein [Iamia sp.]
TSTSTSTSTSSSSQAFEDRAAAASAEVAASLGLGLLLGSGLALWVGAGLVSWWLASAYRCLPRTARGVTPRRAYTLVRTMTGTTLVFCVATFLVGRYVTPEEPLTGALIMLVVTTACLTGLVRALLVVIDMIGDVTFEFCGRHYGTSRAMRLSVLGLVLLPGVLFCLGVLAGVVEDRPVILDAIFVGVLVVYAVALILPVVFVVCLVVSIVLATAGIGGRLREGAEELRTAEARQRDRAAQAASAVPVGV